MYCSITAKCDLDSKPQECQDYQGATTTGIDDERSRKLNECFQQLHRFRSERVNPKRKKLRKSSKLRKPTKPMKITKSKRD